jgi:hypothetical protein
MSSLLTDQEKADFSAAFDNLVDTFKEPIYVWRNASKAVISLDPNFSPFSPSAPTTAQVQNVPIKDIIYGRVLYTQDQELAMIHPSEGEIKIKMALGMVRIKTDQAGSLIMNDVKRMELDGTQFLIESVKRPHGLFNRNYFTYWFKRTE